MVLRFLPPNGCHARLDIDARHEVFHRAIVPFHREDVGNHGRLVRPLGILRRYSLDRHLRVRTDVPEENGADDAFVADLTDDSEFIDGLDVDRGL